MGESQIFRGKKHLILEDWYKDYSGGIETDKVRFIALQFKHTGLAECVGIFDDYKAQMRA